MNSNLIGARKLLEIVDAPPSEPVDDHKPALKLSEGRWRGGTPSYASRCWRLWRHLKPVGAYALDRRSRSEPRWRTGGAGQRHRITGS